MSKRNSQMDVRPMTRPFAKEIQSWVYEAPYTRYNGEASEEGLQELLTYKAVVVATRCIGYYCIGLAAQVPNPTYTHDDTALDLGLGLHPEWTGKGLGRTFLQTILDDVSAESVPLRLTVAAFNERARHLYEAFGFRVTATFSKEITFLVMRRP